MLVATALLVSLFSGGPQSPPEFKVWPDTMYAGQIKHFKNVKQGTFYRASDLGPQLVGQISSLQTNCTIVLCAKDDLTDPRPTREFPPGEYNDLQKFDSWHDKARAVWVGTTESLTQAGVTVVTSPRNTRERANGYTAFVQSKNPEGWVRGKAELDKRTGSFTACMELETDSITDGPKGKMTATLKDGNGKGLASITIGEVGIKGKAPGGFETIQVKGSKSIDQSIASKVASIDVSVECTGSSGNAWVGIDIGEWIIKAAITILPLL